MDPAQTFNESAASTEMHSKEPAATRLSNTIQPTSTLWWAWFCPSNEGEGGARRNRDLWIWTRNRDRNRKLNGRRKTDPGQKHRKILNLSTQRTIYTFPLLPNSTISKSCRPLSHTHTKKHIGIRNRWVLPISFANANAKGQRKTEPQVFWFRYIWRSTILKYLHLFPLLLSHVCTRDNNYAHHFEL